VKDMDNEEFKDMKMDVRDILARVTKIEAIMATWASFESRLHSIELESAHFKGRASLIGAVAGMGTSVIVSVVAAVIIWHIKG